jgi:hypothetical protein
VTLGKGVTFAECLLIHSTKKLPLPSVFRPALGKEFVSGSPCQVSYLCRVSPNTLGKEVTFAECLPASTRQRIRQRIPISGSLSNALYGTRQSVLLCRVPEPLHSAKNLYRCPGLGSLPSAMVLTLGKVPLCRVSHSTK